MSHCADLLVFDRPEATCEPQYPVVNIALHLCVRVWFDPVAYVAHRPSQLLSREYCLGFCVPKSRTELGPADDKSIAFDRNTTRGQLSQQEK